jgi:hypothetical protein
MRRVGGCGTKYKLSQKAGLLWLSLSCIFCCSDSNISILRMLLKVLINSKLFYWLLLTKNNFNALTTTRLGDFTPPPPTLLYHPPLPSQHGQKSLPLFFLSGLLSPSFLLTPCIAEIEKTCLFDLTLWTLSLCYFLKSLSLSWILYV